MPTSPHAAASFSIMLLLGLLVPLTGSSDQPMTPGSNPPSPPGGPEAFDQRPPGEANFRLTPRRIKPRPKVKVTRIVKPKFLPPNPEELPPIGIAPDLVPYVGCFWDEHVENNFLRREPKFVIGVANKGRGEPTAGMMVVTFFEDRLYENQPWEDRSRASTGVGIRFDDDHKMGPERGTSIYDFTRDHKVGFAKSGIAHFELEVDAENEVIESRENNNILRGRCLGFADFRPRQWTDPFAPRGNCRRVPEGLKINVQNLGSEPGAPDVRYELFEWKRWNNQAWPMIGAGGKPFAVPIQRPQHGHGNKGQDIILPIHPDLLYSTFYFRVMVNPGFIIPESQEFYNNVAEGQCMQVPLLPNTPHLKVIPHYKPELFPPTAIETGCFRNQYYNNTLIVTLKKLTLPPVKPSVKVYYGGTYEEGVLSGNDIELVDLDFPILNPGEEWNEQAFIPETYQNQAFPFVIRVAPLSIENGAHIQEAVYTNGHCPAP